MHFKRHTGFSSPSQIPRQLLFGSSCSSSALSGGAWLPSGVQDASSLLGYSWSVWVPQLRQQRRARSYSISQQDFRLPVLPPHYWGLLGTLFYTQTGRKDSAIWGLVATELIVPLSALQGMFWLEGWGPFVSTLTRWTTFLAIELRVFKEAWRLACTFIMFCKGGDPEWMLFLK